MKLAELLSNIAETEGSTQEQLKSEFLQRIDGHKEKELLMACYVAACCGRKYISCGRKVLPPAELKSEGFEAVPTDSGYNYCFG